jgi:virulence factor Mce-like protein
VANGHGVARRLALGALSLTAIALTAIVVFGGGSSHLLRARFQSALQVFPGQQVRIGGRAIGSVSSVSLSNDTAIVAMNVDDRAWPLHEGTTAELRFGGAAAYAARYVQLQPGPASRPTLGDGALIAERDTITPVEFDQIFNIFNAPTRQNLAGLLDNARGTLSGHARDLGDALSQGSGGLEQTAGMQADLASDPYALSTLISAGARTMSTLRGREPQLQGLASGAARTFSVLAENAGAQRAALTRLPATLTGATRTLAHLDESLTPLNQLVADLRPGAVDLRRTAPLLTTALGTLLEVAPLATDTLTAGTRAAPKLTAFLGSATPLMPQLSSALSRLAPMVSCVRPYGPELAGNLSDWTGITSNFDSIGHYARILVQGMIATPGTPLDSQQLTGLSPGLRYAMPRPPGLNAGHPWFQPQCGAGPDALNPADDPEAKK